MFARLFRRFFLLPLMLVALQQSGVLNELLEHCLSGEIHEHHLVLDGDDNAHLAHFHQDEMPGSATQRMGGYGSHVLLSPGSFLLPDGVNLRTKLSPDLSPAQITPVSLRFAGAGHSAAITGHERAPLGFHATLIIPLRI